MSRSTVFETVPAVAFSTVLAFAACAPPATDEAPGEPAEPQAAEEAAAKEAAAEPAREIHPFAAAVEAAHHSAGWRAHQAFAADMTLEFGGDTAFEGRLITAPDAAHTRTTRADDDAVLVFDGDTAWVSPAAAEWSDARFHALTWPYFLAAPHKLADPGTNLEPLGTKPLGDVEHETARLTFDAGVGDAPDDWYVVYRDPASDRVAAMAYIVTFDTPAEEAEQEPHAIVYRDYTDVDGVPIPTTWEFYNWNEEEGVHGDPIGRITVSDPRFVPADEGTFSAPEGARKAGMPEADA